MVWSTIAPICVLQNFCRKQRKIISEILQDVDTFRFDTESKARAMLSNAVLLLKSHGGTCCMKPKIFSHQICMKTLQLAYKKESYLI